MEFPQIESLRRLLVETEELHASSLTQYYIPESNGFRHLYLQVEPSADGFSKASSATCILSLVATDRWAAGPWKDGAAKLAHEMLKSSWKSAGLDENNSFTVAFLLEAVLALLEVMTKEDRETFQAGSDSERRISEATDYLLKAIEHGSVRLEPYPPSAYLTQLVSRVLTKMDRLTSETKGFICEWAWHEIHHQLALLLAKSKALDYFQLAYCIILVSSSQDPGKETPDQSLILQAAIRQLFSGQLPDGSWPRSRPLFHYPRFGNAYCYEYEMLVQLLQAPLQDKLLPHLDKLGLAAHSLRETSFPLPNGGRGWSSGHHSQIAGPESWSTASAYHFCHVLGRLVAEAIRQSVFNYLGAVYLPARSASKSPEFAENFLDCPVRYGGQTLSLKCVILDHFVRPIEREVARIEAGGSLSPGTAMSAILFGPPGTSKTELTKIIADYLGWPRLAIDPSHFVRKGLDQVQAEADRIFGMLAVSERIVVLLDEFDEMVRDRHQASEVLSRFLTTAMLPKLAAINKSRRIVFIVATNYIDQFDLAISRPGRFDLIIQVMPPTVNEKLRYWPELEAHLGRIGVTISDDIRERLADLTYDEFRSLVGVLRSVSGVQEALSLVDRQVSGCTLQSKLELQSESSKTWRDTCSEQANKIRLPLSPGNEPGGKT